MVDANKSRKLWMASRNIRKIPPWKLNGILQSFKQSSFDTNWDHNLRYYLQKKGLKRNFNAYDKNPGGDRTYIAQLKCLGLIYDEGKIIKFTKAGRDFLDLHPDLLLILRKLLLRQQYPSVYSLSRNVNISPSVRVKPLLFLLRLLKKMYDRGPENGYLVKEEIAVAVIYGHNFDCIEKCYNKIKKLRDEGCTLASVIDYEDDLWTKKTENKSLSNKLENILDIANTFDNWLVSAHLVLRKKSGGKNKSFYNPDINELVVSESEDLIRLSADEIRENPVSFQRQFGSWDGKKDTYSSEAEIDILDAEELLLKNNYVELMSGNLISDQDTNEFKNKMSELGFNLDKIEKTITKYSRHNLTLYETEYLSLANGGSKKGVAFEKATHQLILKLKGDIKAELTGQLKRPHDRGAYADIIITLGKRAIIIDTKASGGYDLPSPDHSKACDNYIKNWSELNTIHDLTDAENLNAMCYIAGGFYPLATFDSKLEKIELNTGTAASAIKASDLFNYIEKYEKNSAQEFIEKVSITGIVNFVGN